MDPLARIQEEIKEVERREREYRQSNTAGNDRSVIGLQSNTNLLIGGNVVSSSDNDTGGMSSLNSIGVESAKDEDHQSDDSGISASSAASPINGVSANIKKLNEAALKRTRTPKTLTLTTSQRYIGPNCYPLTPETPQEKLLKRYLSTPQLNAIKIQPRQFTPNGSLKGIMQRFIATRGKLPAQTPNTLPIASPTFLNGNNAATLIGLNSPSATSPLMETSDYALNKSILIPPTATLTPPIIDADGRPIRPGYIPVEVKIQRELQDLKNRESELKQIRKIRKSTSNLLESIDNE